LNRYFGASVVLLVLFVIVATLVSTKVGLNSADNPPITKADSTAFLYINNSHNHLINDLMIWSSKYGRDVFWPVAIILLLTENEIIRRRSEFNLSKRIREEIRMKIDGKFMSN
jgi:hypothetical protein